MEAECQTSDLPPVPSLETDHHEHTQSGNTRSRRGQPTHCPPLQVQRLETHTRARGAPVPSAVTVPGGLVLPLQRLLRDPPGSSEDVVSVDFVSELQLPVLQKDSLHTKHK